MKSNFSPKPNLHDYEAIIFDLGGVIINLDYQKTQRSFEELFGKEFTANYSKKEQSEIFDKLEIGSIDEQEFIKQLKNSYSEIKRSNSISSKEIITAWNAMLLDIPKERIELIQEIGQQKRIFLLSNTNEIHKKAFDKLVWDSFQMKGLEPLFEKAYFSHLVGMRKPNTDIFEFVIKENNLNPSQTLFIDDSTQHVERAKKTGLKVYHLETEKETILDFV